MKAARLLSPLLAGATLILIGANALPSVARKHVLQREHRRLAVELREEERHALRLRAEILALAEDPFVLERMLLETWRGVPDGAVPFATAADDHDTFE